MSFGGNKRKANQNQAAAVAATRPANYSDPFGSFNGLTGVYSPNITPDQQGSLNNINAGLYGLTSGLGEAYNPEDYFNNPFYDSARNQLYSSINQRKSIDKQNLDNSLAARNQLGSSYDALANQYLNQDYNRLQSQADDQARQISASVFDNAQQNNRQNASTLADLQTSLLNALYQPFQAYSSYQNAISPLQQQRAQIYSNAANYYRSRQNPFFSNISIGL